MESLPIRIVLYTAKRQFHPDSLRTQVGAHARGAHFGESRSKKATQAERYSCAFEAGNVVDPSAWAAGAALPSSRPKCGAEGRQAALADPAASWGPQSPADHVARSWKPVSTASACLAAPGCHLTQHASVARQQWDASPLPAPKLHGFDASSLSEQGPIVAPDDHAGIDEGKKFCGH